MNSLSWFLYLAGVTENLAVALGAIGVLLILGGGIVWLAISISMEFEPDDQARPMLRRLRNAFIAGLVMLVVCTLMPSKSTLYMIAASEIGETVTTTPDAQEILDLLKKRIKSLLTDDAGENT